MNIWELCKCGEGAICPFCKILVLLVVAVLCGVGGYLIGRKNNRRGGS